MSNLLSYESILKDRNNFRKAGSKNGNEFNLFDTPGSKFFKLFFYFNNGDVDGLLGETNSGGLLTPTWSIEGASNEKNLHQYNSAWSYLKLNCEDDRAELLQQFVGLLSNISSESPWYFSEISGVDEALNRKQITENVIKIDEQRLKISIKCLPDSFDDRIGTLLDLYRSVVWDWISKREILPSNLKKFDMGLFIFEEPTLPFTHKKGSIEDFDYATISLSDISSNNHLFSYKYIEFHNCEIDYNSSKGGVSTLNNTTGINPEYTIDIYFDDCMEMRYNEFLLKTIGDLIQLEHQNSSSNDLIDYYQMSEDELKSYWETQNIKDAERRSKVEKFEGYPKYENKSGAMYQLAGTAENIATGLFKKAILGNLFTFSLTRLGDQINSLMNGDIWTVARGVDEYIRDAKQRNENQLPVGHSLFSKPKKILPTVQRIGNMNSSKTIANNI